MDLGKMQKQKATDTDEYTVDRERLLRAFAGLNRIGRKFVLQEAEMMLKYKPYRAEFPKDEAAAVGQGDETAWTGYFRDVKRVGSILYPNWG